MKKIIIIGIILISFLFLGIVFAVNGNINTFVNQTNPFNISLAADQNQTFYISVPLHAYVKNVSIRITGENST